MPIEMTPIRAAGSTSSATSLEKTRILEESKASLQRTEILGNVLYGLLYLIAACIILNMVTIARFGAMTNDHVKDLLIVVSSLGGYLVGANSAEKKSGK